VWGWCVFVGVFFLVGVGLLGVVVGGGGGGGGCSCSVSESEFRSGTEPRPFRWSSTEAGHVESGPEKEGV